MEILDHLWLQFGRMLIELIAFGCFEVCVYFMFLRFVERHMSRIPRFQGSV